MTQSTFSIVPSTVVPLYHIVKVLYSSAASMVSVIHHFFAMATFNSALTICFTVSYETLRSYSAHAHSTLNSLYGKASVCGYGQKPSEWFVPVSSVARAVY